MKNQSILPDLIAPCGMDCGVCRAHLREKNKCPGCRNLKSDIPVSIQKCKMRQCTKRGGQFCCYCKEFPCDKLKHLDKRYREKYGMSEIENLESIRDKGMLEFLASECKKYCSNKGTLCVHDRKYYKET